MLANKKLTDCLFSPYDFGKNDSIILITSKMNETDKTNLTGQTKFRLNEINKFKDYFDSKINQRKSSSKKLSKYVAAFDYIDNILIVLSPTSGGVSTISFTTVIGAPARIGSASFTLVFSLATGIIKKLLRVTISKKKKHDKIFMLAKYH